MKLVRFAMGFENGSEEKKEFHGKVNFALVGKDEAEVYKVADLMEKELKNLSGFCIDFLEEWNDGRPSLTVICDSDDIEWVKDAYKTAKKNM